LFTAALVLYTTTLARGMLQGDALDFQLAMITLGVPHPTGYPLFTLLGWLWVHLFPWGDLLTRASLLSAIFGALTVAMVYRLALHLTGRHLAALAGAIALALSYVFWTQTAIVEAYTLNAFFLTQVFYWLWQWEAHQDGPCSHRYLLLAASVYGFSLAHHRLMLVILPAILVYVWQVNSDVLRDRRSLLRLALLVGAGLLFYLYIPWRALPQGATVKDVVWKTILGAEYSIFLGWRADWLQVLWHIPRQQFGLLGLVLAAVGAGAQVAHQASRRRGVFLLLAYACTVLFCFVYWVPDPEVFLTPCFVIIALWISASVITVAGWVGPRLRPVVEISAVLAALLLLTNLPRVRAYAVAAPGNMRGRAEQILSMPLESQAIIQADWETATALRYLQAVQGVRPDLVIERLQLGLQSEYERLLSQLDSGRVVFFPDAEGFNLTRFSENYSLLPVDGGLLKVVRDDSGYEQIDKAIARQVSLRGYRTNEHNLTLYWQLHEGMEENYASYVHFFDADLQPIGQADKEAMREGSHIFPTSHWTVGQVVQDNFVAPPPSAAYVRAGLYTLADGTIQSFGRSVVFTLQSPPLEEVPNRLDVSLGGQVMLRGFQTDRDGETLRLILYWGSEAGPSQDYTVFVHVVEGEQIVAQQDQQPLAGFYPTSMWREGEIVKDVYALPLPPTGTEIRVGLYDPNTMQRLPRADADVDYVIIR
jgi:hypothetical protein